MHTLEPLLASICGRHLFTHGIIMGTLATDPNWLGVGCSEEIAVDSMCKKQLKIGFLRTQCPGCGIYTWVSTMYGCATFCATFFGSVEGGPNRTTLPQNKEWLLWKSDTRMWPGESLL